MKFHVPVGSSSRVRPCNFRIRVGRGALISWRHSVDSGFLRLHYVESTSDRWHPNARNGDAESWKFTKPGRLIKRRRRLKSSPLRWPPNCGTKLCAKMCAMKKHKQSPHVRRSVLLPRRLMEEVSSIAAPAVAKNWNRLVISALEEYAERRKRAKFEDAMAAMAADPAIRAEGKRIDKEFRKTERDKL
jgi:hypothetical protein